MKKSDVKVGVAYAYADYEHGQREKVVVLEVGVQGKNWKGNTITGHRVQKTDGTETVVEGRYLWSTWESHQERLARERTARRKAESNWHQGRVNRADTALSANRLLNALGHEDQHQYLYTGSVGDNNLERVVQHAAELGFHVGVDHFYGRDSFYFVLASASVMGYFTHGNDLVIPSNSVPALVEAAEVFL